MEAVSSAGLSQGRVEMSTLSITVEAVFEDGVLRPLQPLTLAPRQQVTLRLEVSDPAYGWPPDVAEIYREIAEEDRRIAESMWAGVKETWPPDEVDP
jgi:predicted DNA-binding antitoxin AbrB/MazE fold protein